MKAIAWFFAGIFIGILISGWISQKTAEIVILTEQSDFITQLDPLKK